MSHSDSGRSRSRPRACLQPPSTVKTLGLIKKKPVDRSCGQITWTDQVDTLSCPEAPALAPQARPFVFADCENRAFSLFCPGVAPCLIATRPNTVSILPSVEEMWLSHNFDSGLDMRLRVRAYAQQTCGAMGSIPLPLEDRTEH